MGTKDHFTFETTDVIPATANDDYYFVLWLETDVGQGSALWIQMAIF